MRPAVEEALVKDQRRPGSIPTSSIPGPANHSVLEPPGGRSTLALRDTRGQHAAVVPGRTSGYERLLAP